MTLFKKNFGHFGPHDFGPVWTLRPLPLSFARGPKCLFTRGRISPKYLDEGPKCLFEKGSKGLKWLGLKWLGPKSPIPFKNAHT